MSNKHCGLYVWYIMISLIWIEPFIYADILSYNTLIPFPSGWLFVLLYGSLCVGLALFSFGLGSILERFLERSNEH